MSSSASLTKLTEMLGKRRKQMARGSNPEDSSNLPLVFALQLYVLYNTCLSVPVSTLLHISLYCFLILFNDQTFLLQSLCIYLSSITSFYYHYLLSSVYNSSMMPYCKNRRYSIEISNKLKETKRRTR